MDYEKKYKDALEKIREGLQPLPDGAKISGVTRAFLEEVFPELAESEDEKIRKGLIKGLSAMRDIHHHQTFSDDAISINDALAWLEKQGEPKQEWSEEDERMYKIALSCIETLEDIAKNMHADVKEWLKSIKDRMKGKEE